MSCHYKPYCEHYKIKKLQHKKKSQHKNLQRGGTKTIVKSTKKSALIIVNVQNDFMPGGVFGVMAHEVDGGVAICNKMVASINDLIQSDKFDYHIYTQDAHHPEHMAFASNHEQKQPFDVKILQGANGESYSQVLWPDHCVINDKNGGTDFYKDLIVPSSPAIVPHINSQIVKCTSNEKDINILAEKSYILSKGHDNNVDSYSAFKNAAKKDTILRQFLMKRGVTDLYICGLARDFSAWWTAADATTYINNATGEPEFKVFFVLDATLPVPGPITLPEYDINGTSLHQQAVAKIGRDKVYNDLTKNIVHNNLWVAAFLTPYGIKTVSVSDVNKDDIYAQHAQQVQYVHQVQAQQEQAQQEQAQQEQAQQEHAQLQLGGTIFTKSKVRNNGKLPKVKSKISTLVDPDLQNFLYQIFKKNKTQLLY